MEETTLKKVSRGTPPDRSFSPRIALSFGMSKRDISVVQSDDKRGTLTVETLEEVDDGGVLVELEVVLHPETSEGTVPDKWSVTWVHYTEIIEENFKPFIEKYCPEPEKVFEMYRRWKDSPAGHPVGKRRHSPI